MSERQPNMVLVPCDKLKEMQELIAAWGKKDLPTPAMYDQRIKVLVEERDYWKSEALKHNLP